MAKHPCPNCKQFYEEHNFAPANHPFTATGHSEFCVFCLEKLLNPMDINQVDALMRHLNLPLFLNEWTSLAKQNGDKTLRVYLKMFGDGGQYMHNRIDWSQQNYKWKVALEEGELDKMVPVFTTQWMTEMRQKWQVDYTIDQFVFLEDLYANLLKSQNILPGMSQSLALMLCKLILSTNEDLKEGKPIKDKLAEIKNVMSIAGFEAKGSRNTSDFDTAAELFVWLGKKGWQPKFYDGNNRDEVDIVIKDVQAYLRRLVLNEPSLADQVQQRKDAYIASKQLEQDAFMGENEFDEYESAMLNGTEYEGDIDLEDSDDDDSE